MKNLYLYFNLLVFINLNAQKNNVCVNYSITIQNENMEFEKNSVLYDYFKNAFGTSKTVEFTLIANKLEDRFYKVSKISLQDDKYLDTPVEVLASYEGETFLFKDCIYIKDVKVNPTIFEKSQLKNSWVLTSESKKISGYLCYKATREYIANNSMGVFKHPVVAWYCPQLPIKSGPNGYGNLPGLILELQIKNAVYGATKIDLNCNQKLDNSFLSKVKTVSHEERMEIYRKMD